jgi:hypothetical protein
METNFSVIGMAARIDTPAQLGNILAAVVVTYRTQGPDAGKENLDILARELRDSGFHPQFCILVDALRAGLDDFEGTQSLDERMW